MMISLSLDNRALIEFRITVYNKSITDLVANLQFQHWTVESSLTLGLSKEFSAVMNMKEINVMGTLGTTKRVYNMTTRMATKYTLKCLWLYPFKTIKKCTVTNLFMREICVLIAFWKEALENSPSVTTSPPPPPSGQPVLTKIIKSLKHVTFQCHAGSAKAAVGMFNIHLLDAYLHELQLSLLFEYPKRHKLNYWIMNYSYLLSGTTSLNRPLHNH